MVQKDNIITQLQDTIVRLETKLETTIMRLALLENAHPDMQGTVDTMHEGLTDLQMTTHARLEDMDAHVTEVVKTVTQLPTAKGNEEEGSPVWGGSVASLRTIYEKAAQEGSLMKHASQTKVVTPQAKTS